MKGNSIRDLLASIQKKYMSQRNPLFNCNVETQKKYISGFKEPTSYVERSFFQYKCQFKIMYGSLAKILFTIGSLFLIIYILLKRNIKIETEPVAEAVFIADGKSPDIVPLELKERFTTYKMLDCLQESMLTKKDREYIFSIIKKYPFSYFFLLKVIIKISEYSAIIHTYHPKTIIVCNEYSFTSSVLTDYCHIYNVNHINVMHGEKLYYIRDSFFRYDECFVWEQHYKDLLISLRADAAQFKIAIPENLKFCHKVQKKDNYDFKYYLANENQGELLQVKRSLDRLKEKNYRIKVRPHPRYTDLKLMKDILCEYAFEDNHITIEESLMETRNAIALCSTVLNQALYNDINIVIDDVVNPDKFEKLKQLRYLCLDKPHLLLSMIIT